MLTPQRLLRIVIEVIFIFLGALAMWLGSSGQIAFDVNRPGWLILSAALILWGLRALYKPGQWWSRWEHWTRGLSLILLGAMMLAISRAPFQWVGRLIGVAGAVLILRGLIGSILILREP
jgi:hypothetical protein